MTEQRHEIHEIERRKRLRQKRRQKEEKSHKQEMQQRMLTMGPMGAMGGYPSMQQPMYVPMPIAPMPMQQPMGQQVSTYQDGNPYGGGQGR
ncbi:hypothetical protein LTR66_011062 [Elasticomyces elasticus]|nr:hypothetical protein LTR66_011062 [Elasticomyces elasticus]